MKPATVTPPLSSALAAIARFAAVLFVFSMTPKVAAAQDVTTREGAAQIFASPHVPPDHQAYADLDRLKNAAFVKSLTDTTHIGRTRPMTRYEIAAAIARLTEKFPVVPPDIALISDSEALRNERNGRRATMEEVEVLDRLVYEFRPELERSGQNMQRLYARMNIFALNANPPDYDTERVKKRVRSIADIPLRKLFMTQVEILARRALPLRKVGP